MSCEILAPVGGGEQLKAAVRCGADAVYLGVGDFNARRGADNFQGRLREVVSYCHVRNVTVHAAVNILVMDSEWDRLIMAADEAAQSGVDAVILQDLGAAAVFRERYPSLPRHASTQMTIHNLDGAKLMADMGFSRVVLSRELTLREIEYITANCGIETEVFIHGALCMCMSGACYLSSMLGGRSGNRGLCAQPCRLNFRSGTRSHVLSLKDMSHLEYLRDLADVGVTSFKIEGRMKRPEYVAAAVTAARKAIAGEDYDRRTLRAVFSRSGFTDGYITGRRDANMFGTRQKEDVTAAPEVLGDLAALYRGERQSVPVDMTFVCGTQGSLLSVTDGTRRVSVEGESPEPAITRPLTSDIARKNLVKTGGTPYFVRDFEAQIESGLSMPASKLNDLRRRALEALSAERAKLPERAPLPTPSAASAPYESAAAALWGRFQCAEQFNCAESFDRIIMPVDELIRKPEILEKYGMKIIAELPALLFGDERERLVEKLEALRRSGLGDVYCDNLYGVRVGRELGLNVHGGSGLNVINTCSLNECARLDLQDITVSFELPMREVRVLGGSIPRGIIIYGRLPLMKFRVCPVRDKTGCHGCNGRAALRDRKNIEFPVICSDRKFGTLLNSVPLYVADRDLPKLDFHTLWFTTESRADVDSVTALVKRRTAPDFPATRGLYYRKLY